MSEYTDNIINEVIESNRKAIRSNLPEKALRDNPNLLSEELARSESEIKDQLNNLRSHYEDLLPHIKRLKNYVKDITEETHYCAVYLLFCQTIKYWDSIFLLSKYGNSSTIQLVTRTIKESTALAVLFSLEFHSQKDINLKKWFSGEIVTNEAYRNEMNEFFKGVDPEIAPLMQEMSRDLYRMESHSIHVAYTSVLECISPFTKDFDFEKYTQFRRTSYNFGYVKGAMDATNISLKFAYMYLLDDIESGNLLEKILVKHQV